MLKVMCGYLHQSLLRSVGQSRLFWDVWMILTSGELSGCDAWFRPRRWASSHSMATDTCKLFSLSSVEETRHYSSQRWAFICLKPNKTPLTLCFLTTGSSDETWSKSMCMPSSGGVARLEVTSAISGEGVGLLLPWQMPMCSLLSSERSPPPQSFPETETATIITNAT